MGLGRSLLRSLSHKKRRKDKKPSVLKTIGAVAATAVVVKALFDKYGDRLTDIAPAGEAKKLENYTPPQRSGRKVELEPPTAKKIEEEASRQKEQFSKENEDLIYTELGKLALCWYVAGIDGDISESERAELDKLSAEIRNDGRIPQKFKDSLTAEILVPGISFNTVRKYLDHADPVELIELTGDIEELAKADGVSEREQYAVDVFKHYVEEKTGHRFTKAESGHVDLTCPNCSAVMTVSSDSSKAVCEYCGHIKVF